METTLTYEFASVTSPPRVLIQTETKIRFIYIVIGALGLLGNTFVVIVIFNGTAMRKHLTNTYIINQSLVDACVSLFLILTSVVEDDGRKFDSVLDSIFCKVWLTKMWLWGFLLSSTMNLLALTLERYLAIVHPIWHKTKLTKQRVYATLIFVWIFGPAYNFAYMFPTSGTTADGHCTIYNIWPYATMQNAVGVLTIFIQYIGPLMLLCIFYTRMILVLHRRIGPEDTNTNSADKRDNSMARARRNILKTLIMVGCCFIVCWTCNQVYFLLFNLGATTVDFTTVFYHFTVVMVFMNCCINPFIYIAKYEQFQRAMRRMFCKKRNQERLNTSGTSVE